MWKYGEKINAQGEFNPRMMSCDACSEYFEPEDMGYYPLTDNYHCEDCKSE
jgi:hypothetical protein